MEPSTATDNFKNAVFYGIYPKSFFDSDGDGVGDLKGILSKLPYLVSLGADVIVLSSLFETTSEDLFFAPTDLCRVNPAIGTIDDFEELVSKAHESGLKVFLSFPLSATSVSHPWFEKSKESLSLNPYREYYTWQVGRKKSPPDNKKTRFKTPLWSFDAKTNEWYRSFYGENYPELNYDNPRVRKDISDVFRFWKEKGVDGINVALLRLQLARARNIYNNVCASNMFAGGFEREEKGIKIPEGIHRRRNRDFRGINRSVDLGNDNGGREAGIIDLSTPDHSCLRHFNDIRVDLEDHLRQRDVYLPQLFRETQNL